jgi:hypothetical protein
MLGIFSTILFENIGIFEEIGGRDLVLEFEGVLELCCYLFM